MSEACAWAASEHGCDVDCGSPSSSAATGLPRLAGAGAGRGGAARAAASSPRVATGGGSDANALRRRRLRLRPARQRHRGQPHPRGERRGANLDAMLEVCEAIVGEAGREAPRAEAAPRRRSSSEDPLTVEVDGERRRGLGGRGAGGGVREGDEVVVNVEALDLGLGSGGFDIVHVNLTRGLEGGGRRRERT